METFGKKLVIGIMTDEDAMFEILSKFLTKEGYETRRLPEGVLITGNYSLVVFAPTRDISLSKVWFENLKRKDPKVLVVQCCEEDVIPTDDNVVVLSERPLNLKQLSSTINRTLRFTAATAIQHS